MSSTADPFRALPRADDNSSRLSTLERITFHRFAGMADRCEALEREVATQAAVIEHLMLALRKEGVIGD